MKNIWKGLLVATAALAMTDIVHAQQPGTSSKRTGFDLAKL